MNAVFWILTLLLAAMLVMLIAFLVRLATLRRLVGDLITEIGGLGARFDALENRSQHIWKFTSDSFGRVLEIIESGQACRMGEGVLALADDMRRLNRRMNDMLELIEKMETAGRGRIREPKRSG